jgi:hypothetical protein
MTPAASESVASTFVCPLGPMKPVVVPWAMSAA